LDDRTAIAGSENQWLLLVDHLLDLKSCLPDLADSQIQAELIHTFDVAVFAAERGGARRRRGGIRPEARKYLVEKLRGLIEEYRRLWLLRSRPGGLEDSCNHYRKVLEELEG
jgi:hypothetical protein